MTDPELADILIERLNALIEEPAIRLDVDALMKFELSCSDRTTAHPTIQTHQAAPDAPPVLRLLGLLNGACGTIPEGRFQGWGFIAAEYDDDDKLVRFLRTDG